MTSPETQGDEATSAGALTPQERELIDKHGGLPEVPESEREDYEQRLAELAQPNSPTLLPLTDVMRILGTSEQHLRDLAEQGHLQILRDVRDPDLEGVPAWQICEGAILPGLSELLAELSAVSPLMLEGFVLHGDIEDDKVYGVTEWLMQGGDPERVLEAYPFLRYPSL